MYSYLQFKQLNDFVWLAIEVLARQRHLIGKMPCQSISQHGKNA